VSGASFSFIAVRDRSSPCVVIIGRSRPRRTIPILRRVCGSDSHTTPCRGQLGNRCADRVDPTFDREQSAPVPFAASPGDGEAYSTGTPPGNDFELRRANVAKFPTHLERRHIPPLRNPYARHAIVHRVDGCLSPPLLATLIATGRAVIHISWARG
jgi:hypothetical protein